MNANELILDYVAMCEKLGALDFSDFVDGWLGSDVTARMVYLDADRLIRRAVSQSSIIETKLKAS